MNHYCKYLFLLLLLISQYSFSQLYGDDEGFLSQKFFHLPSKEDNEMVEKYKQLINDVPSKENYKTYYLVACSLWELERTKEAEQMFSKIISSKGDYYEKSYRYSSDIEGDTSTKVYGYGSYKFNYKHYACVQLAQIYIEEEKYKEALKYIKYAEKKYLVSFSCGTGWNDYKEEMRGLYGYCYEGLGKYEKVVDMLIPYYDYGVNLGILISSLKKQYTYKELVQHLEDAENSIVIKIDSFSGKSIVYRSSSDGYESKEEILMTYSEAKMNLFGHEVRLLIDIPNGTRGTKEQFIEQFRQGLFYGLLTNK